MATVNSSHQPRTRLRKRRQTVGLTQEDLAERVGVNRSTVVRWENGTTDGPRPRQRPRLAEALRISIDELEYLLVQHEPSLEDPARASSGTPGTVELDPGDFEGEAVQRREFLALAGTSLAGAVVSPSSVLQDLALTLIDADRRPTLGVETGVTALGAGVGRVKEAHQACRYELVAEELPALLSQLKAAGTVTAGDDRRAIAGLTAQALHVAASVFLKLDGHTLASVAADRSMEAARRSEDPLVIAASARIVTHTLMSSGQYAAACQYAAESAAELDRCIDHPSRDSLSLYGALILRGAIAAAQNEDGPTARALLDEATQTAVRLASGANHHWTAFGDDNVLAHRAAVEINLGNAGTAIDHVRAINFDGLGIAERRATVFIDAARAYSQWGKYDQAVSALNAVSEIAVQELRVRPPVRELVGHLRSLAPRSVQSDLQSLVDRVGFAA